MVSGEGIQVDPKKIKVVIDWLRPITVTKVRSSLDLAGSLAHISTERRPSVKELHGLIKQRLQLKVAKNCLLAQFRVRLVYLDRVKATQRRDPLLQKILFEMQQGQSRVLVIDNEGTLCLGTKLCVPDVDGMRKRRLWKYISNPSHVLQPEAVKLREDLTYKEYPVAIVD